MSNPLNIPIDDPQHPDRQPPQRRTRIGGIPVVAAADTDVEASAAPAEPAEPAELPPPTLEVLQAKLAQKLVDIRQASERFADIKDALTNGRLPETYWGFTVSDPISDDCGPALVVNGVQLSDELKASVLQEIASTAGQHVLDLWGEAHAITTEAVQFISSIRPTQ